MKEFSVFPRGLCALCGEELWLQGEESEKMFPRAIGNLRN